LKILETEHGIKREDLFIQTKYTPLASQDATKPLPYDPATPLSVQLDTSLTASLRNLNTTYLDSYVIHGPLPSPSENLMVWRKLAEFQDAGKVKRIGVSNVYDVSALEALSEVRQVQVVQNRWYEGNKWDSKVSAYCRERNIQYQSFWTLSGSPSLLRHPSIRLLAESATPKCTPAQAVYRLAQLHGITPLCGSTNEEHMREAVAVEGIEFDEGVMTEHGGLVKKLVWG